MSIDINGKSLHPFSAVRVASYAADGVEAAASQGRINEAVSEYYDNFGSCRWLSSLVERDGVVSVQWDGVPSVARQEFLSDALAKAGFECVQKATAENSACASADESGVAKACLRQLSEHFNVYEQVWGTHLAGGRLRIDAIVTPKDVTDWANKDIALGIEFKNEGSGEYGVATKDYTRWLAQCADYANTKFDGFGFIPVFAYGGMSCLSERSEVVPHLMGQLGVGELVRDGRRGLTFVMSGHHWMWSAAKGVEQAKRWKLLRKFGSK